MKNLARFALLLTLAALLSACASSGGRRISEPAASLQQLTVDAAGNWSVQLRLQNYSSVPMRFESVDLALVLGGVAAGNLVAQPALDIGPESADVLTLQLVPAPAARLQVADALASGRSIAYSLDGDVAARPEAGGSRQFRIQRNSALSPAPGLPGVLR